MSAQARPDLIAGAGEQSQRLTVDHTLPREWWRLFRSPRLNGLVQQALAKSPSIAAARSRLARARQAVREAGGAYYPQVDAAASAQRLKGPPFALGTTIHHTLPTYNLYTVGATVSFVPDVFGLTARRVEQQQALTENQAYQLAAAQLAVTGNVVREALIIAAARSQIRALEAAVAVDRKMLALERRRFTSGKTARTDALTAESRLANDRARLPPLQQQIAIAQDALAILGGQPPAVFSPSDFALADFTLPADLPVSLPSTLVERRPDILAAEARLHAASAAVGVADAQMYPNFTVSASAGTAALATSSLGAGSNLIWTLFGGLTAPIFHGGMLSAQKQAAVDQFHADLAVYRQTVLEGLGQVADQLQGLGHDAERLRAEHRALAAAAASLNLQRHLHAAGKSGLLPQLDAQRSYELQRSIYTHVRAQRFIDSAQLFVALGGGWTDRSPPRPPPAHMESGMTRTPRHDITLNATDAPISVHAKPKLRP